MNYQIENEQPLNDARTRLVEAGIILFAEKGYAATSVREIVEKAGVSKPVLYYYFRNKQGIFQAILDSAAEQFEQILKDIVATPGTVLERLLHFYQHFYQGILLQHQDLYRMVRDVIFAPPQKEPTYDIQRFERSMSEAIKTIYQQGIEKGEVKPADPEDIATLVMGLIDFCFHIDIYDPECRDPARPERLLQLAFNGIALDRHHQGEKNEHGRF
ncbi:MAG: TetR/AcrR family transcriptional regulator [Desulfobacteraceae bacterium]|nr:MAG: TetR/AcrR family transcriptional regulator [Desulfobacteraceae bacterium]